MIRKRCFENVGYFNEELRYSEDYDLWLRTARYYNFGYVPQVLAIHNMYANRTSAIYSDEMIEAHLKIAVDSINKWGADWSKAERNNMLGYEYFIAGDSFFRGSKYNKAKRMYCLSLKKKFSVRTLVLYLLCFLPSRGIDILRDGRRRMVAWKNP